MKVVVATTLTTYAMEDRDTWWRWLENARSMQDCSHELNFFAAIETDGRGRAPFEPLLDALSAVGGSWWWYSLDDGRREITERTRTRHISAGMNLIAQYATDTDATHLLFLGADTRPPADVVPKLLQLGCDFVGGDAWETYRENGRPIYGLDFPVHEQFIPFACVMFSREIFSRIRFRSEGGEVQGGEEYMAHQDIKDLFGYLPLMRKDVVCQHFPEAISKVEERYPGRDMRAHP